MYYSITNKLLIETHDKFYGPIRIQNPIFDFHLQVTLVLAFLVCWSPFQFVQLAKTQKLWNLSPEACHQLIDVATILAYANSMINPILYTVLGKSKGKTVSVRFMLAFTEAARKQISSPKTFYFLGSKFYRRLSSALNGFGSRGRGSGFSRSSTKSLNRATSLKVKTTTTIANNKVRNIKKLTF